MIEREKTYLVKYIPVELKDCKQEEIIDIYFTIKTIGSSLRLRQRGDKYELTKKHQLVPGDASSLIEDSVQLTKAEFTTLSKASGKGIRKVRYYFEYEGKTVEMDVFKDELKGLVLAEIEFSSEEEKLSFSMPDFCFADVTQEDFVAGSMLSGRKYQDIEKELTKFSYQKLDDKRI